MKKKLFVFTTLVFVLFAFTNFIFVNSRHINTSDNLTKSATCLLNVTVVDDETGEALPGVTVRLKGTLTATTTDLLGHATLSLPQSQHTVVISMIGYKTQEISFYCSYNGTIRLVFDN